MSAKQSLKISELRDALSYDEETGLLYWREPVGIVGSDGYVRFSLNRRNYLAHRAAWALKYGEWPIGFIDHIDGDRSNNKASNLRQVSPAGNARNKATHGTYGLKGVYPERRGKTFNSAISAGGKYHYLGSFSCPAAANFAYQVAADKLHQEYAVVPSRLFRQASKTETLNSGG